MDWNWQFNYITEWRICVALLTESVDWNKPRGCVRGNAPVSLSSRRAWIEILNRVKELLNHSVALLTESVDWNCQKVRFYRTFLCRSPHGERGLKSNHRHLNYNFILSRSPHGERGLKSLFACPIYNTINGRSPHGERGLKSFLIPFYNQQGSVALLTESVDWNCFSCLDSSRSHMSLSSRRAWIEIGNKNEIRWRLAGRSPHGERGLKYF